MRSRILWIDDEIEHLEPQVIHLSQKGFEVLTSRHPSEAMELLRQQPIDLLILDEHMPGIQGIELARQLKRLYPHLPIVMVTKDEEESLIEEAVGVEIADFLIKPVKPQQLFSTCKRLLSGGTLLQRQASLDYQREFRRLSAQIAFGPSLQEWWQIYRDLVHWDIALEKVDAPELREILEGQKAEANLMFGRFFTENYLEWVNSTQRPPLSPDVLESLFLPHIGGRRNEPTVLLLIDGMRYDQWKVLEALCTPYYHTAEEHLFFSILPTATQYARNSLFSGLFPVEIAQRFPRYWADDDEEGGKNLFEEEFFIDFLHRHKIPAKTGYVKVLRPEEGKGLMQQLPQLLKQNEVVLLIFNFLDLMAHTRVQMNVLKELAANDIALRATTRAWLESSTFFQVIKTLPQYVSQVFITTDHGFVQVRRPIRVLGDRETTTNLRYKQGRNLSYDKGEKGVYHIRKPEEARLPRATASATYLFALEDHFLVYPTNYNEYVRLYRDSYQHGGISMEEIIVPFVRLEAKV
ncbi:MAG: bifunctional response regulator/alkaline phosphatase family protein [Bacteroidia bacterium]|nr:PglZ domain-containing protein [Bacteroidia bacterium]MDW8014755.1 bifunctional response regulator/alkaline phosphatase family protein [Bacteroidia bacterium]